MSSTIRYSPPNDPVTSAPSIAMQDREDQRREESFRQRLHLSPEERETLVQRAVHEAVERVLFEGGAARGGEGRRERHS